MNRVVKWSLHRIHDFFYKNYRFQLPPNLVLLSHGRFYTKNDCGAEKEPAPKCDVATLPLLFRMNFNPIKLRVDNI